MKACNYCGRESADEDTSCKGCGRVFPITEFVEAAAHPPPLPAPKFIDAAALDEAFSFEAGFHRAKWDFVRDWIDANIRPEDCEAAWNEAMLLWAGKLRDDLGGQYYVMQSPQTVLVCDLDMRSANWLLGYAGAAALSIRDYLGNTAWEGAVGKDLVLVFSDQDDYYQYLSFHSADGEQASSGGVCIHSGYTHIALPWSNDTDAANAVIHELTHDCLAHLPLPLWLNEGVAVTLQKAVAPRQHAMTEGLQDTLFASTINWRPPIMWDELAERHFGFWTPDNIQTFWAGTSFYEPGDPNELSYSLAEVFVKLLSERGTAESVRAFIEAARREDAGQDAAARLLKADLGEIAGTFLGEGKWRPDRRQMIECWKGAGWEASE